MVKLLGGGSDLNTVVSDMNSNLLDIKNREVTTIFKDDQGNNVVILDKNGLLTKDSQGTNVAILDVNGLRTTTPGSGIDVLTATAVQLSSDSRKSSLRIVESGTVTIPGATVAAGGNSTQTGTGTFVNSFSSVPIVIGFKTVSGTTRGLWSDGTEAIDYNWGSSGTITIAAMSVNTQTTTTSSVVFSKRYVNGESGSVVFVGATIIYYVLQQGAA